MLRRICAAFRRPQPPPKKFVRGSSRRPVSLRPAGISYNKFPAKLASDHRKPNGQFVITPEMGPSFIEELPVGKFHGVGPVTADKMKALGIHTGPTCVTSPSHFCNRTSASPARGIMPSRGARMIASSAADRPRKSSGSETTFAEDLTAPPEIEAGVIAMADDVWACAKSTRCLDRR